MSAFKRVAQVGGGIGLGYFAYTMYQSGGNVKVAEKQVEADFHKTEAKIKSELPGRPQQAKAEAATITEKAKAELARAESISKDAGQAAMKKIDEMDRTVEKEAAKAKSGISSWFGGK